MDVSGNISAILNQKSREIFAVSPDASVYDAISMLDEKNVGAVLVMEDEKLVGMFSERDYTRKVVLRGKRSRVMRPFPATTILCISTSMPPGRPGWPGRRSMEC